MHRDFFKSKAGFIAAAAGSAVGLGNIWAFPYQVGENGGAAFVMVYLVAVFLIAFPVMVAEISIGRAAALNPYGAFVKLGSKNWGFVGLMGVLIGFMILSFYNVIAGISLMYFIEITFGGLLQADNFGAYFGGKASSFSSNAMYAILFMVLTCIVVARGISKGIEVTTKVLMPLLLILLLALIVYGLTLEGSSKGLSYYLNPDFDKIDFPLVYSALGQAFFSLSLGMGGLLTYGSYVNRKENLIGSAGLVTVADTGVAILAGLLIFPLLFSQGGEPAEGPALVFITLPGIFQQMGLVTGTIIGSAFFLLLCFGALTSTISLMEVQVSYLVDELKWKRVVAVAVLGLGILAMGIPSMLSLGASDMFTNFITYEGVSKSFLDMIVDIFSTIGLPLGGFLICLFVTVKWKRARLAEEIEDGYEIYGSTFIKKFLDIMIGYVCPIVLGSMFLITVLQMFFSVKIF